LFLAKGIMSYRQVISSCLYIFWKELVHSLTGHFRTPVKVFSFKNSQKSSRAAKNALAGHMARVFETPALDLLQLLKTYQPASFSHALARIGHVYGRIFPFAVEERLFLLVDERYFIYTEDQRHSVCSVPMYRTRPNGSCRARSSLLRCHWQTRWELWRHRLFYSSDAEMFWIFLQILFMTNLFSLRCPW